MQRLNREPCYECEYKYSCDYQCRGCSPRSAAYNIDSIIEENREAYYDEWTQYMMYNDPENYFFI